MEALTALTPAAAVVQLVDFGIHIFSASTEIRSSVASLPDEIVDLEATTKDLEGLVDRFRIPERVLPKDVSDSDKKLSNLAQECTKVAEDLLRCIAKIKRAHNGQSRKCGIFCRLSALSYGTMRSRLGHDKSSLSRANSSFILSTLSGTPPDLVRLSNESRKNSRSTITIGEGRMH